MSVSPANRLHLGVAYYPEHWPEIRWPEDVRLMVEAGVSVVRMGDFAWPMMEPEEGVFDFAWLERAIEMWGKAGIETILSTPGARPPAWLIHSHPDVLAVDAQGIRGKHRNPGDCCVNSPAYHEHVASIIRAMAARFGSNPNVIGWQIGNVGKHTCYCDHCRAQFQRYLQDNYESLGALKERWAMRFWGQSYSDWAQISLPDDSRNPELLLEFKRFRTASYRRFQRVKIDVLRPHLRPEAWIMQNVGGWAGGLDGFELTADVDRAGGDWQIGPGRPHYPASGAIHDWTRNLKRQNFWAMENRSDAAEGASAHVSLHKGEGRALVWHAVAHGAQAVLFAQWRPSPGEQPHPNGLLDASGRPRLFFAEARQLGHEFAAASKLLAGSKLQARAAIIFDYDSRWSGDWQAQRPGSAYVQQLLHYYRPLAAANVAVDIISPRAEFMSYSLVIAPAFTLVDDEVSQRLQAYVKRGGYLILTTCSGMKDRFNTSQPQRQLDLLAGLAGIDVEESYALDKPIPVKGNVLTGQSCLWAERLHIFDEKLTQVIARFGVSNGWLDHQAAITVHPFGKGMVYYVGGHLDDVGQRAFMALPMRMCGLKTPLTVPAGVEVIERVAADGRKLWIIINHTSSEQRVQSPRFVHEHLAGVSGAGNLRLAPYGVLVLTEQARASAPTPLSLPRVDANPKVW